MKDEILIQANNIKIMPVVKIGINSCTMKCPKCSCDDLTTFVRVTGGKHCITQYRSDCPKCGQLLDWDWEKINKKLEPQQNKIDIKMNEISKNREVENEINRLKKLQNKLLDNM